MSDIDPATAIRNLCQHIGDKRATSKSIKHRFFYYNYTNDRQDSLIVMVIQCLSTWITWLITL